MALDSTGKKAKAGRKRGDTKESASSENEDMSQQSRPSIKTATLSRVKSGPSPEARTVLAKVYFMGY